MNKVLFYYYLATSLEYFSYPGITYPTGNAEMECRPGDYYEINECAYCHCNEKCELICWERVDCLTSSSTTPASEESNQTTSAISSTELTTDSNFSTGTDVTTDITTVEYDNSSYSAVTCELNECSQTSEEAKITTVTPFISSTASMTSSNNQMSSTKVDKTTDSSDISTTIVTCVPCESSGTSQETSINQTPTVLPSTSTSQMNEQQCTPGQPYYPDSCNICVCSDDGKIGPCTLMSCGTHQSSTFSPTNEITTTQDESKPTSETSLTSTTSLDTSTISTSTEITTSFTSSQTAVTCECECVQTSAITEAQGTPTTDPYATTTAKWSQECTPGKLHRPDSCNYCICTDDGKIGPCTMNECNDTVSNSTRNTSTSEVETAATEPTIYMEESTIDKDQLTTATANDEIESSSDKTTLGPTTETDAVSTSIITPECLPGKLYRPDSCNYCLCTWDGKIGPCTNNVCPSSSQTTESTTYISTTPTTPTKTNDSGYPTSNSEENTFSPETAATEPEVYTEENTIDKDQLTTATTYDETESSSDTLGSSTENDAVSTSRTTQECLPGKLYRPDSCNYCVCTWDGKIGPCTKNVCPNSYQAKETIAEISTTPTTLTTTNDYGYPMSNSTESTFSPTNEITTTQKTSETSLKSVTTDTTLSTVKTSDEITELMTSTKMVTTVIDETSLTEDSMTEESTVVFQPTSSTEPTSAADNPPKFTKKDDSSTTRSITPVSVNENTESTTDSTTETMETITGSIEQTTATTADYRTTPTSWSSIDQTESSAVSTEDESSPETMTTTSTEDTIASQSAMTISDMPDPNDNYDDYPVCTYGELYVQKLNDDQCMVCDCNEKGQPGDACGIYECTDY